MAIKKRTKVSAEFSMSSMTDIIFLLLIFFMLTSSLVAPNSLNLKLPSSSTTRLNTDTQPSEVSIDRRGAYRFDGRSTTLAEVDRKLKQIGKSKAPNISLAPDPNAPIEAVVPVMDLALRYNVNALLSTEK